MLSTSSGGEKTYVVVRAVSSADRAGKRDLMSLIGVGVGSLLGGTGVDVFARHLFGNTGLGHFATVCAGGIAPPGSAVPLAQACHAALTDATQYMLIAWAPLMLWPAVHSYWASRTVRRDLPF